jgi:hypothetical protein
MDSLVITAVDQAGNCAERYVRPGQLWTNAGWANAYSVVDIMFGNWEVIYITLEAFGQELSYRSVNVPFGVWATNGDNQWNPAGVQSVIRLHLDNAETRIHSNYLEIIAVFADSTGGCAYNYVNRVPVWDAPDFSSVIHVEGVRPIDVTITAFGRTVTVESRPHVTAGRFYTGHAGNASNGIRTRVFLQTNGEAGIFANELEVVATFSNGACALDYLEINRIWNAQHLINRIDVSSAARRTINIRLYAFGELFAQYTSVPAPAVTVGRWYTGHVGNAANGIRTRVYLQSNGLGGIYANELQITAVYENTTDCAIHHLFVNRIWNNTDFINRIDIRDTALAPVTVTLTAFGTTHSYTSVPAPIAVAFVLPVLPEFEAPEAPCADEDYADDEYYVADEEDYTADEDYVAEEEPAKEEECEYVPSEAPASDDDNNDEDNNELDVKEGDEAPASDEDDNDEDNNDNDGDDSELDIKEDDDAPASDEEPASDDDNDNNDELDVKEEEINDASPEEPASDDDSDSDDELDVKEEEIDDVSSEEPASDDDNDDNNAAKEEDSEYASYEEPASDDDSDDASPELESEEVASDSEYVADAPAEDYQGSELEAPTYPEDEYEYVEDSVSGRRVRTSRGRR